MIGAKARAVLRRLGAEDGERGSVIILVAVLLMGLIGFCGLALDYGRAGAERRQAQNAADAAAQVAAYEIYAGQSESTATTEADLVMTKHGYTSGNLTSLRYLDSTGSPTLNASSVNSIQSVVTSSIPTTLMGVFGLHTMTVTAGATLSVAAGGGNCAFCLMSSTQGYVASGTNTVAVNGGNIWINDLNSGAITGAGTTTLTATQIGVAGPGPATVSGTTTFTPTPTYNAGQVQDPLANVPAPSVSGPNNGSPTAAGSNQTVNLSPGIYTGLTLSGSGTVNFPTCGVYVFAGSMVVSGTWNWVANACTGGSGGGVMIYFTCSGYSTSNTQPCNGSSGAGITWSGTAALKIAAPTSGTYKGLAIFYDRGNTQGITLSGSQSSYTGTIYAKDAPATLSGSYGNVTLNSRVILSNVTESGSPNFTLNFNSSQNYSAASLPVFTQ